MAQLTIKNETPLYGFSHRIVARLNGEIISAWEGDDYAQLLDGCFLAVMEGVDKLDNWSITLPAFFEV